MYILVKRLQRCSIMKTIDKQAIIDYDLLNIFYKSFALCNKI